MDVYVPICQRDVLYLSKIFVYAEARQRRCGHTFEGSTRMNAHTARTGLMVGHRRWLPVSRLLTAIIPLDMRQTHEDMHNCFKR
jgi:hypothetical protein